jgi:hypothetical protein
MQFVILLINPNTMKLLIQLVNKLFYEENYENYYRWKNYLDRL